MPTLIDQRRAALASARRIVDAAKAQNRDNMTADEVKTINGYLAEVDELDLKIKAANASTALLNQLGMVPPGVVVPASDVDGKGVNADAFGVLHRAAKSRASIAVDVDRKALLSVTLPPSVAPAIVGGDYRDIPSVLGLFSSAQASGPVVRSYRVSNPATAAQVLEGAAKPDAGITVDFVDTAMVKIANQIKITDESVEDYPAFMTTVSQELGRAVKDAENTYGVTTILAASGLQTVTGENVIDGTADAIAVLASTFGIAATGAVLNPLDLAAVRKSKAATAGTYFVDPQTSAPNTLHGLPLVVTSKIAAGTVLVGSFATAGVAYMRSQVRVDIGLSEDDFVKNVQTMRSEERVALAITRASHLVEVTVTP